MTGVASGEATQSRLVATALFPNRRSQPQTLLGLQCMPAGGAWRLDEPKPPLGLVCGRPGRTSKVAPNNQNAVAGSSDPDLETFRVVHASSNLPDRCPSLTRSGNLGVETLSVEGLSCGRTGY